MSGDRARELDSCAIRVGTNHLAQAVCGRFKAAALPAAVGVHILRTDSAVPPIELHACPPGSVVSTVAWCPASPDLLALSHSGERAVKVWRVAVDPASPPSELIASLDFDGPCRQLVWHPNRRLLCAASPHGLVLWELGQAAKIAAGGPAPRHELSLPPHCAGAISCCCWGGGGAALAAACEGEVVLFRWAVAGMAWGQYTHLRLALGGRAVRSIAPLAASQLSQREAFALGLVQPIATAAGSELRETSSSRISSAGAAADAGRPAAEEPSADEVIDLRGVVGGMRGGGGIDSLLDLSAELEPQPLPSALRAAAPRGAVATCVADVDSARLEGEEIELELASPDLLAHHSPPPHAGDDDDDDDDASGGGSLLVVTSTTSDKVFVLSSSGGTLCVFSLPTGFRARGVAFGAGGRVFALAARREKEATIFSSPSARQQLRLCSFDPTVEAAAAAASGQAAQPVAQAARPSETSVFGQRQGEHAEQRPDGGAPMGATVTSMLNAMQSHLDGRFDRIESVLQRLETRIAHVEAKVSESAK